MSIGEKEEGFDLSFYEMTDIAERFIYRGREAYEADFGSGATFNTAEIHMLTDIVNNPGTTVTRLAEKWGRTKGAISQSVKKLETKSYIYKEKSDDNQKIISLYPTEEGKRHAKAHMHYDETVSRAITLELANYFSKEQMNMYYKIMNVQLNIDYYSSLDLSAEEKIPLLKISTKKAIEKVMHENDGIE